MKPTRRQRQKMNKQNGTLTKVQNINSGQQSTGATPLQQRAMTLQKLKQMINEQAANYAGRFYDVYLNAALKLLDTVKDNVVADEFIEGTLEFAKRFTERLREEGEVYTQHLMNVAPINDDLQHMYNQTLDEIKEMESALDAEMENSGNKETQN